MVFRFVNDSPRIGNDENGCSCVFPMLGNLAADRIYAFPVQETVLTVGFIISHFRETLPQMGFTFSYFRETLPPILFGCFMSFEYANKNVSFLNSFLVQKC